MSKPRQLFRSHRPHNNQAVPQPEEPTPRYWTNEHRPITAGGFVKSGPIVFEDIAAKAGLTSWTHQMGTPAKSFIIEAIGSGVALLDYDNDGWLDIYLVNGSTFDALDWQRHSSACRPLHNNHDGTFTDVAAKAGVTNDRWGFGVAVGDYDNDGWPDIYVSNFGKNRLYHNNHDGTFTDVAEKAGVAWATGQPAQPGATTMATGGSTCSCPAMSSSIPTIFRSRAKAVSRRAFAHFRGVTVMCGPRGLPASPIISSTTTAMAPSLTSV